MLHRRSSVESERGTGEVNTAAKEGTGHLEDMNDTQILALTTANVTYLSCTVLCAFRTGPSMQAAAPAGALQVRFLSRRGALHQTKTSCAPTREKGWYQRSAGLHIPMQ